MGEKLDAIGQFICMGIMLCLGWNEKEGLLACIGITLQLIVYSCVFQTGINEGIEMGREEEKKKRE